MAIDFRITYTLLQKVNPMKLNCFTFDIGLQGGSSSLTALLWFIKIKTLKHIVLMYVICISYLSLVELMFITCQ